MHAKAPISCPYATAPLPRRSAISGHLAVVVLGVALLAGLRLVPLMALAAFALISAVGLFKADAIVRLWRGHRAEFVVAVAAPLAVFGSAVLQGVQIGALVVLSLLSRHTTRPRAGLLGHMSGTRRFSGLSRHRAPEKARCILVFRPESGPRRFPGDHVRRTVLERVRGEPTPPTMVVIDLSVAPDIDADGAEALAALGDELEASGIRAEVVRPRGSACDPLVAVDASPKPRGADRFRSVRDLVETPQDAEDDAECALSGAGTGVL